MMDEIWKDIEGYEASYQVSSLGNVRSLDRVVMRRNGYPLPCKGQMLKPALNPKGYLYVTLRSEEGGTSAFVHRLVLGAFVGPCPEGHQCNHRNGIKDDNRLGNLEWATGTENMRHAHASGLVSRRGEANSQAKLSSEIAEMIRNVYALGRYTQEQIGLMFGVCGSSVGNIVRGETWGNRG